MYERKKKEKAMTWAVSGYGGHEFLHVSENPVSEYFLLVNHGEDQEIRSNASEIVVTDYLTIHFKRFFS